MRTHAEKSAHYRVRAAELRELANGEQDDIRREKLLKSAADYDRLARVQDGLAANDPRSL